MSKYTKGPWKVVGGTGLCISSDNGKTFIGSASLHGEIHYDEAKANANLMAASPELLEALEFAYDYLNYSFGNKNVLPVVRSAIDKAKGETIMSEAAEIGRLLENTK